MNSPLDRRTFEILCFAAAVICAPLSTGAFGTLLLNYQFEQVDGAVPTQTTVDSSGTYADAVNQVLGPGTMPGTDYPLQIAGPVGNGSVMSLNPNNAMFFTGPNAGNTNSSKVSITDGNSGLLDTAMNNFTFATWVKPTFVPNDAVTDRLIAGKAGGSTSSTNRGWQISSPPLLAATATGDVNSLPVAGGDDLLITYFQTSNAAAPRILLVENALPLNTWTHIAFTFSSDGTNPGVEAVYVNGIAATVLVDPTGLATAPTAVNGSNAGSFMAGARAGTANNGSRLGGIFGWIGGLDDVRVYSEALAPSAIGSPTGVGSLLQVPEPSSIVLAAVGLLGAVVYRRRTANQA